MARPFDLLLSELRTVYENHQELMAFAPFCQDVATQKIEPNPLLCGQAPRFLHSGDVIFHAAQQPHALQTHEAGVLALVFWRNGFGILPVLSEDPS